MSAGSLKNFLQLLVTGNASNEDSAAASSFLKIRHAMSSLNNLYGMSVEMFQALCAEQRFALRIRDMYFGRNGCIRV